MTFISLPSTMALGNTLNLIINHEHKTRCGNSEIDKLYIVLLLGTSHIRLWLTINANDIA